MGTPRNRKPAANAAAAPSTDTTVSQGPVAITLENVIEATKADGFVYTPVEFHQPLVDQGLVEVNPEMTNEAGHIATRATEKAFGNTMATEEIKTAEKPKFEIESGVAIPEKVRNSTGLRAGRTPVYPFDSLEVGQSFFIPNKGDKSAAKAMASTVAGANARHSQVVEGKTRTNRKGAVVPETVQLRKFKIFDTERTLADGSIEKGARIFRMPLTDAS